MIKSIIISLTLLFLFSQVSYAQNPPPRGNNPLGVSGPSESTSPVVSPPNAQQRIQSSQQNVQEKRAQFQTKLKEIKDIQKKLIVEKINTNISTVNQQATTKLSSAIDKLSLILSRINTQVQAIKANGTSTTTVESAVSTAQESIAVAKAAVTTQKSKAYVIDIVDENSLKSNVGVTVSQFRADLQSTQKNVKDAQQAVVLAARELAKLTPTIDSNNATSSSQIKEL